MTQNDIGITSNSTLELDISQISFPSHNGVTYKKMKDTIIKFAEFGGGPFTQKEILDKMKDIGNINMIAKRVVPFLDDLEFIERSRMGQKGVFTYKLKPEIRERLKENPEEFDSVLVELSKKFAGYLVIWKYAEEEKGKKFTINAFEQYLTNKMKITYSSSGLIAWLNALDKVKLLKLEGDFISLEGIPNPKEEKRVDKGLSSDKSRIERPEVLSTQEGFAPGMTINVKLDLDYRQSPELQREYMEWLARMASKPNVMISVTKKNVESEFKSEKRTDQD